MLFHNISRIENGRIITYDDDPGWIGVDLDGTLAEYHGFKGMEHIGDPIPAIVEYVKELLEMGERVKIFTARVDRHPEAVAYIQQWLQDVGLPILEVTCIKDAGMKLLVDDRTRQVKANTGKFVDFQEEQHPRDEDGKFSPVKQGPFESANREFKGLTPKEITHGHCLEWAQEFKKRVPGAVIQDVDLWPHRGKENLPYHVWVKYKGKLYDAEHPEGVNSFKELNFFKEHKNQAIINKLKSRRFPTSDSPKPKRIASGEGFDFWLIGNDVYRAPTGSILDIYGAPQAKRWECTYPHWQRFREVFSWAKEVRDASRPVAFTTFQGLRIGIENPKGSIRKGVDEDGEAWKTKMYYPYGYIQNTEGVDGDEVDCFVGPNPTAPFAYVINLKDADHEEKVMLGFATKEHARDAFCAHYDQPEEHLGPIREMKMEDFKRWLKENR